MNFWFKLLLSIFILYYNHKFVYFLIRCINKMFSCRTENDNPASLWKMILYNQKQAWLKMSSGSMSPLMPTGALILVRAFEHQQIKAGDIVLFTDGNQLVAHRLLWINWSQNQCLQGGDSAVSTFNIPIDTIFGVVEKVKVNGKEFDLNSRAGFFYSVYDYY
jgi:hypothetical protein